MSGKIATSEAAQLWEESRAIREWSAERIKNCDEECRSLRGTLGEALARIYQLEEQLEAANELIEELKEGRSGSGAA